MTRAFYALGREQKRAFRSAVSCTRDGRAPDRIEQAWSDLDILGAVVNRTHTLELFERVEERLALLDAEERAPIEAALFGGPGA